MKHIRKEAYAALVGLLVLGPASGETQAPVRQVLLLQRSDRGNMILDQFTGNFRVDLDQRAGRPVNFVQVVVGRTGSVGPSEEALVAFVRSNYDDHPAPDLIVAVAGPAAVFARKYRQQLFPDSPLLFAAVDQRYLQNESLGENETAVAVVNDFPRLVDDMLQVLPETRQVFVVLGSGEIGRFWRQTLNEEFKRFRDRVTFVWSDDLSLAALLRTCASLPEHSAILYLTFGTDAAGAAYADERVLAELHATANAPLFAAHDVYLGSGIVGGSLMSIDDLSRDTAGAALRILSGESPSSVRIPARSPGPPIFDWRELQRWGVAESQLPPGSVVRYRSPGLWREHRAAVLIAAGALVIQSFLIMGLLLERRARKRAEVEMFAVVLAKRTGKPVRLEWTLSEEMAAGDTRHPFIFETRWGLKKDGTITAQYWKVLADTGGYASSGPAVVLIAGLRLVGTYRTPNYVVEGYGVYSNNQVAGEFRGFGGLQAGVAQELHADKCAQQLGMNPLDFRLTNTKRTGDLINNDHPYGTTDVEATIRRAAERIGWERWQPASAKTGLKRRGLGMMQGPMPSGREASDGLVYIDRDGKVHVRMGTGNLGNLAHTGMAVIVSEVLGVPIEEMRVGWADTDRDPWTLTTDSSRSCHCDGKAAYNAAKDCARQLVKLGAQQFGTAEADFEVRGGMVGRRGTSGGVDFRTLARAAAPRADFDPWWEAVDQNPLLDQATGETDPKPPMKVTKSTEALAQRLLAEGGGIVGLGRYVYDLTTNAWGSCFAEVEVDMRTGQVDVLRMVVAHEIGRVLYPAGAEAQIHGGALQGLGFAMTEDLVLDPQSRIPVNTSYYEYRPPTSLDYPEMIPILLEAPGKSGPFGAKGLGESPIFGPAPAIGNAIFNATGVLMPQIPYTWDRVYDALKAAGKLIVEEHWT